MSLQKMPIHRSLTRPLLVQGGEQKPMYAVIMTSLFFIFMIRSLVVALFGVLLFFVGREALRRLADKVDPNAGGILWRHYKYRKYYKAHPTAWGVVSVPKKME